ncbi:MAG: ATP-binding cassette domain-containing protein [Acidobacteria bacterium]|nr:ATP-binding cassette domain-containing protein [Acidobacteriota bacterium]MCZ6753120.1 ATP-binding cassette domain-containing protein [Acidobacteriota bacterium]
MIEVQGLTKRYGRTVAVQDINFSVKKGEILGFLGPNGAGKTTTMRVLTGFLPPTLGKVTVAGYDVMQEPLEVKRRIGYLPETPPLYPDMRVTEMLAFAGRIKGVPGSQLKQHIAEVSEKTAISDVSRKLVGQLSKGYRQRVGLAAALIHNPEVLVLDEPTAGLDPKQIIETRKLITSLAGEHTIILSTHILPEAANTCGRVMIINAGKLVAEDTPENLTARLQGYETMNLVVEGPEAEVRERLSRVTGVSRVSPSQAGNGRVAFAVQTVKGQDVRKELARAVVESGWGLLELRPVGLSLEEIFLKLTTTESADGNAGEDSEETAAS